MTNKKKVISILVLVLVSVFAWHLLLTILETRNLQRSLSGMSLEDVEYSASVNPVSDAVTIKVMRLPDENPFSALGDALAQAALPGLFEPRVKEVFDAYPPDPYAIVVPHSVRVVTSFPDFETSERMRARKEKASESVRHLEQQANETRQEFIRTYVKDNLSIEKQKVGRGSHYGGPPYQDTAEGEVVNSGKKSLRKVTVRFYFLDSGGKRIGEPVEYSPVLVTEFSFGDDNAPLRPGQRKSFGYLVGDKAPDGWAKKIEAEIVDFKFLDQTTSDTINGERLRAQQASTVGSLRTINTSEITYSSTYTTGFSSDLQSLGGPVEWKPDSTAKLPANAAGFIDEKLASGTKSGYRFTYVPGPVVSGVVKTYSLRADPMDQGISGVYHYYTDQTGVIRVNERQQAGANDPPLEG